MSKFNSLYNELNINEDKGEHQEMIESLLPLALKAESGPEKIIKAQLETILQGHPLPWSSVPTASGMGVFEYVNTQRKLLFTVSTPKRASDLIELAEAIEKDRIAALVPEKSSIYSYDGPRKNLEEGS